MEGIVEKLSEEKTKLTTCIDTLKHTLTSSQALLTKATTMKRKMDDMGTLCEWNAKEFILGTENERKQHLKAMRDSLTNELAKFQSSMDEFAAVRDQIDFPTLPEIMHRRT